MGWENVQKRYFEGKVLCYLFVLFCLFLCLFFFFFKPCTGTGCFKKGTLHGFVSWEMPFAEGYVCPLGTGVNYTLCEFPDYCPEGSNMTLICPLGHKAVYHEGIRYSVHISCSVCPAGTFGNDTERALCLTCPPGYYCPEGKELSLSLKADNR